MKLERVGEFHAMMPLKRELETLQNNVADALANVPSNDRQQPVAQRRRVAARQTGVLIRPGDLVVADSGASIELVLAQPGTGDDGKELMFIKQSAAGTVTLRVANATINNAATLAVTAVGITRIVVDGGNYWA